MLSTSRYNFIETKLSPVDIQFPDGGTEFPAVRSAAGTIPFALGQGTDRERERERERKMELHGIERRTAGRRQRQRLNVTVSPDGDAGRRFLGECTRSERERERESKLAYCKRAKPRPRPIRDDVVSQNFL